MTRLGRHPRTPFVETFPPTLTKHRSIVGQKGKIGKKNIREIEHDGSADRTPPPRRHHEPGDAQPGHGADSRQGHQAGTRDRRVLRAEGLEFESQARDLPGRPDFVFRASASPSSATATSGTDGAFPAGA